MSSTTTTLNPGAGGDSLDESLVQQDTGAAAKRARVNVGNENGQMVDPQQIVDLLGQILVENQRQTTLLRMILSSTSIGSPDLDEVDAIRST